MSVQLTTVYISSDESNPYQKQILPDPQTLHDGIPVNARTLRTRRSPYINRNVLTTAYVAGYSLIHSLQLISSGLLTTVYINCGE